MNEWDERDRKELAVIDAALRTYPLASVPRTLAPAVFARIESQSPTPRFRLLWIDYVLGLFGVGMVALVLLFGQVLLPNGLLEQVPLTAMPYDVQTVTFWLVGLIAGVCLLGCCIAVVALVLRPNPARHVRFRYSRWGIF